MVTDPRNGGMERVKGGRWESIKRNVTRRKLAVIVLCLVLFFATIGIWYFLVRPWSIQDLAGRVVGEEWAPGFDPSLAGSTVRVAGTVTDVDVNHTSLGPLTLIELDNFGKIHLVEWKESDVKVGDFINRNVHFERSRFNDERRVYSPQLDFPGLILAISIPVVMASVSCISGICPMPKNDPSSGDTIVEVTLQYGEDFPLSLFNASLRKGVGSWVLEYIDATSWFLGNPIVDSMESLEDGIGVNRVMRFTDANSNGLLDDGDYFRLNLTRPVEDSAFLTYSLAINVGYGYSLGVLTGGAHIAMTNRGMLWVFGDERAPSYFPGGHLRLTSEVEVYGNISVDLTISDVWGPQVDLELIECNVEQEEVAISWLDLTQGNMFTSGNHTASFTDADNDGFLSEGDSFTFSGLSNWTYYSVHVLLINGGSIAFDWTTGIGDRTGQLPVIEWEEPVVLDSPSNHLFRLQVKRMYGVSGIPFQSTNEAMVVDVTIDGVSALSFERVTSDLNYTSAGLVIEFEDADGNGYFNSGDYFICNYSGSAQLELTVGYTDSSAPRDCPQPMISWPVSWQTG